MDDATVFVVESCCAETVVLEAGRALDFRTADAFKQVYQEHLRSGALNFILDFSQTGILDSTGLGAIFALYRQVRIAGGEVVFAAVSRPVQAVMQITRIHRVFRQFPTVEAACGALSSQ